MQNQSDHPPLEGEGATRARDREYILRLREDNRDRCLDLRAQQRENARLQISLILAEADLHRDYSREGE